MESTFPFKLPKAVQQTTTIEKAVILQGVVDHVGNFIDVYAGWPGRVHDSRVLHNSELYAKAECGKLFYPFPVILGRNRVPAVILGDPAYPLMANETLH